MQEGNQGGQRDRVQHSLPTRQAAYATYSPNRRRRSLLGVLTLVVLWTGAARQATGQLGGVFGADSQFDLSDTVQLDRADSTVLAQFERVKAYLADRQWDEAVDTLQKVMENSEGKLLGVTEHRYVGLGDYCQLQFATLPPEALAVYRARLDPTARKWYTEGAARRDRKLLENVVQQALASSWGDKALLDLGEMALESGDDAAARWYWERILPVRPPPGEPKTWPGYPDTKLDPAMVRARLVLASILEGDSSRARAELAELVRLHPAARGWLGGREVNYAEALGELLTRSAAWPKPAGRPDWPTFAGAPTRNQIAPRSVDVAELGEVAWRMPLFKDVLAEAPAAATPGDSANLLSYYPLLLGDRVFVNNQREIAAVRLSDGRPVWGENHATIFREQMEGVVGMSSAPPDTMGVARFTLTARDGRLFARMGNPVTSRPPQATWAVAPGYLVCLDLQSEGKLLWKTPAEEGWAFEGSPLADAGGVYVAMRRSDIRSQAHVACFDAQNGHLRWRRFICGAETPARGVFHQSTHNLLTLQGETLYYNTNLGAVAALSTDGGRLLWVSLYPRARHGNVLHLSPHWQRDLTPCLYHAGTLLVAPADTPAVFALDAGTGQMLWRLDLEDVTQLLGVAGDCLIASGRQLYWIGLADQHRGRLQHVWPDSAERLGYGRGVLAGGNVFWPTREKIYVFDQQTAELKKAIDLAPLGARGGNLLVADGRLLIANRNELIALGPHAKTIDPKRSSIITSVLAVQAPSPPTPLPQGARGDVFPTPLPQGARGVSDSNTQTLTSGNDPYHVTRPRHPGRP